MPFNYILEVELFDVWGVDVMGPFPSSRGDRYVLVVLDMGPNERKPLLAPLMTPEWSLDSSRRLSFPTLESLSFN